MELIEKKLNSEKVYNGGFLKINKDTVILPNGKQAFREYVVHPGAVVIVPVTEKNTIILEKQYRYPVEEILIEVPSGKLDSFDEDPLTAAKRELEEETGYSADQWIFIGDLLPLAAYSTEKTKMYLAKGLKKGKPHTDSDEFVETFELPFDEAIKLILENKISDANTQTALLKAKALGFIN